MVHIVYISRPILISITVWIKILIAEGASFIPARDISVISLL
jgi:hypothetical protein